MKWYFTDAEYHKSEVGWATNYDGFARPNVRLFLVMGGAREGSGENIIVVSDAEIIQFMHMNHGSIVELT